MIPFTILTVIMVGALVMISNELESIRKSIKKLNKQRASLEADMRLLDRTINEMYLTDSLYYGTLKGIRNDINRKKIPYKKGH